METSRFSETQTVTILKQGDGDIKEVVLGIRTGCYATICDQRRVMDDESNPQ
jgi:hypothetical protein